MPQLKKFLANGIMMTAVALALRTVGVSFNVYISNKIGAEALGLFTLLGSVYSFALTFATSGINLTTTRMVSDAVGRNDDMGIRRAMMRCIIYALSFGIAAAVLLFFMAGWLGSDVLKDIRTVVPLKLLSITLPLISVTSALNGYFTAMRRVSKNAAVQIYEQFVHIVACVFLLELIFAKDMESSCTALVLGGAISEVMSFCLAMILYVYDKKKHLKKERYFTGTEKTTKKMLSIALPLAFSAYFRSALLTIEHILIPAGLEKSGADRSAALISYGTLHSMVMPIVLFPSAFIQSFAGLLIPELAELKVRKNDVEIRYVASRTSQLALIFSIGVAGIMICFSGELGYVIYGSEEAGNYIRIIAPIIPIMYFDTTVDAMLKGLGEQLYSMNVNIIDSMCSVIMVRLLIPVMGIYGYIAMIMISEFFNAAFSIMKLMQVSKMKIVFGKWIVGPLSAVLGSTALSNLFFAVFKVHIISGKGTLALHIAFSAILYLLFICLFGALDREDIRWIRDLFKKKQKISGETVL